MNPSDPESSPDPDDSAAETTATAGALESATGGDESQEKQKLSLEIAVDEPSACERHVTVTISGEDVERYVSDAFDDLMPKAEVPGFRPGRAPRKLVENRFKQGNRRANQGLPFNG